MANNNLSLKYEVLCISCLLLVCCGQGNSQKSPNGNTEESPHIEEVSEQEAPIVKDSIDLLMDQRAEQVFNSTIFAGLRFGSNKKLVERTLRNKQIIKGGSFHTEIPIQVPVGEKVQEVIVRDYDATYYNDQLASLTLYANEANLLTALSSLYSKKYGITKDNEWRFQNCEIVLSKMERREDIPDYIANYLTYTPHYYDTYRGYATTRRTTERYFIIISYKDYSLLNSIERQQYLQDSLENVKRLKDIQKEKELAKKLEEEIPTNI